MSSDTFCKRTSSTPGYAENSSVELNSGADIFKRAISPGSATSEKIVAAPLDSHLKEILPLQKDGSSWKYLQVLANMLELEGYGLVGKDVLATDKAKWPQNLVRSSKLSKL
jgi:hypothetical protein